MKTRMDEIINNYITTIPEQDDLDSGGIWHMIEQARRIYSLDCVFVFENLTFRNDFIYSYYSVKEGYDSKLGTIVQFNSSDSIS